MRIEYAPLAQRAADIVHHLSLEIDSRRVGSAGNRAATDFCFAALDASGFGVARQPFKCIDWRSDGATLTVDGQPFPVLPAPYGLGCDVTAPLVAVATVMELEVAACRDAVLLLHGPIAAEPLMPKAFPFYNPAEHQAIVRLLENRQPAAIVAATGSAPGLAGGQRPFPLIEDGDFDIPSVYLDETHAPALAARVGRMARVACAAERIPAAGCNVIARAGGGTPRIVVTAHVDAKPGTPGALDNAAGVAVALLLAELLASGRTADDDWPPVEFAILNGEDYYSAPGQVRYLAEAQDRLHLLDLVINIDGVGYHEGRAAYSMVGCGPTVVDAIRSQWAAFPALVEGPVWYQGDHMPFVQQGVPALAITSERLEPLTTSITHTPRDRPELVDFDTLATVAVALSHYVASALRP